MHVNSTPIYFVYVKIIMYIIMSYYFVCVAIDILILIVQVQLFYIYTAIVILREQQYY